MPLVNITVANKTKVEKAYKEISQNIASIVDITQDRVFIISNEKEIYQLGEKIDNICIVDIAWLKRSLEMRKEVGNSIRETLTNLGFEIIKITFKDNLPEDMY